MAPDDIEFDTPGVHRVQGYTESCTFPGEICVDNQSTTLLILQGAIGLRAAACVMRTQTGIYRKKTAVLVV